MLVFKARESDGERSSMQERLTIQRPKRWDHPLDPQMDSRAVAWLCSQPPFSQMDASKFQETAQLLDILRNDTRIARYERGISSFAKGTRE